MATNSHTIENTSGLAIVEPLSCSTSSVIIEDWLGDELGSINEHWEAEAYTLLRARPQVEAMFSVRTYHLTVATAEIMCMETDNENDKFVWLIEDDQREEISRGHAAGMLSAQCDCERKMHEIAAADRA